MSSVREGLDLVLFLFVVLLMVRLVLDWVQVFARDWRPRGLALLVAEPTYTLTDPPIRLVRRLVPPLRLGGVSVDLAFLIVLLLVWLLRVLLRALIP